MIEIVDTNVILRFLVGDDKLQRKQALDWFKAAESGKRKLLIKPIVVAESCFVLESFYKKTRSDIAGSLETFLSQKWLMVDEREVLLSMWKWYRQDLHFVDSFLIAWASIHSSSVLTFDKRLIKGAKKD
jgi:predicted nucleic-acid-binding protein